MCVRVHVLRNGETFITFTKAQTQKYCWVVPWHMVSKLLFLLTLCSFNPGAEGKLTVVAQKISVLSGRDPGIEQWIILILCIVCGKDSKNTACFLTSTF